jgi:hypothetical protein
MGKQDMEDALPPSDHQALANAIEASEYWAHATELVHSLLVLARENRMRPHRLLAYDVSGLQSSHLRAQAEVALSSATRMAVAGHGTLVQPLGYASQTQPIAFRDAAASLLVHDATRALALSDTLEAVRFKFVIGAKGIPENTRFAIDATLILGELRRLCIGHGLNLSGEVQPALYAAIENHMASRVTELRGSTLRHQEVKRHNEAVRCARLHGATSSAPDFLTRSRAAEQIAESLGRDFARRLAVEETAMEIAKGAHQQTLAERQAVHSAIGRIQATTKALASELELLGGGRGTSADRHSIGSATRALAAALADSFVRPPPSVNESLRALEILLDKPGALDERWGATREPVWKLATSVQAWLVARSSEPAPFNWRATHSGARGAIFAAIADIRPSPSLQLVVPAVSTVPPSRRRMKA